jgi:hypothetical protein
MIIKKLAGLALGSIMAISSANAAVITYNVAYGVANAQAAETAFLAQTWDFVTEDFNGFSNYQNNPGVFSGSSQEKYVASSKKFITAVGKFRVSQDALDDDGEVNPGKLMIESTGTGEYGRGIDKESEDFWLDSNDTQRVRWDLEGFDPTFDGLGFYLVDANDYGATLILRYRSGENVNIKINTGLSNGNVAYVSLNAHSSILGAYLIFDNNGKDSKEEKTTNDGWSIDNVSVVKVPEPTSIALMSLGIIGLLFARKR